MHDWGPFAAIAVPSAIMSCVEWWTVEIGMVFAGDHVYIHVFWFKLLQTIAKNGREKQRDQQQMPSSACYSGLGNWKGTKGVHHWGVSLGCLTQIKVLRPVSSRGSRHSQH